MAPEQSVHSSGGAGQEESGIAAPIRSRIPTENLQVYVDNILDRAPTRTTIKMTADEKRSLLGQAVHAVAQMLGSNKDS